MNYYHFIRREIEPLLPPNPTRILEVGAGAGGTLKWLKARYPGAETTAVELNSELRDDLTRNVDVALIGPIEDVLPALKTYDLILLLDVLEHLTRLGWRASEALGASGPRRACYRFGAEYCTFERLAATAPDATFHLSGFRHPRSYASEVLRGEHGGKASQRCKFDSYRRSDVWNTRSAGEVDERAFLWWFAAPFGKAIHHAWSANRRSGFATTCSLEDREVKSVQSFAL